MGKRRDFRENSTEMHEQEKKKGEKIRKQIETKWNEGTGKRVDRKQNGRIIPLILAFQRNDSVIVDAT